MTEVRPIEVENGTVLDIGRDIRSVPCEVTRKTDGFVDTRCRDLSDSLKYWYSIDVLRNLEFDRSYLFSEEFDSNELLRYLIDSL